MPVVKCEFCKIEIDIPEGYAAPFIQCPDCGSHQRYIRDTSGEPTFKILDQKGRERAINKVVGEEVIVPEPEKIIKKMPTAPAVKQNVNFVIPKVDLKSNDSIIDDKQYLLDSFGEKGLNNVFELVAGYMASSSEKARKSGKSKTVQALMKEKYTGEMATKAVEFAEKSEEVQNIIKKNKIKKIVILSVVAVIIAVLLITLL